ncbi:TPA: DNA cytosine methyltransferase [Vibrio vulnificus]|nr:DNA cytosine methyltransferase [Vibrio vulnificus]
MTTVIHTYVTQTSAGAPRIWTEGNKLERGGFSAGDKYQRTIAPGEIRLTSAPNGDYIVSKRTRNNITKPLIEVATHEVTKAFPVGSRVRIVIRNGFAKITLHKTSAPTNERLAELKQRLLQGLPLRVASFCHGGGVLDHAFHAGLKRANVESKVSIVVERESEYLESSLRNNPHLFDDDTLIFHSEIQWLNPLESKGTQADFVVVGIPCEGASKSGRSKNQHWGSDGQGTHAESHSSSGHLFYYVLEMVRRLQPIGILIENVTEYAHTASMEVIRSVLSDFGYTLTETIVNGNAFGALENRDRLCAVAVCEGIELDLSDLSPVTTKEATLSEVLEPISDDSPMWKPYDYLRIKEERDKAAGKGFKRQLLDGTEPFLGTIGKGYAKCRSTEPFIKFDGAGTLTRLLTLTEHCKVKKIPTTMVDGCSNTVGHEILGQSVIYSAFEAVGLWVGNAIKHAFESICHENDDNFCKIAA